MKDCVQEGEKLEAHLLNFISVLKLRVGQSHQHQTSGDHEQNSQME